MWDYFITELWKYQWTREEAPLTDELREVLYDESQGIVDIVVKLFMLAQLRAISHDERHREVLTPRLLRRVAAEEFQIIRPMIEALRHDDPRALELYDDLEPFKKHVETRLGLASNRQVGAEDLRRMAEQGKAPAAPRVSEPGGTEGIVRSLLESSGIAPDVAEAVLGEANRLHPSGDPFLVIAAVREMLEAGCSRPKSKRAPPRSPLAGPVEGDLRGAVAGGGADGLSAHDALRRAGVVADVAAALATTGA